MQNILKLIYQQTLGFGLPCIFLGPFFDHLQKSKDKIINYKNIPYRKVMKAKWSQNVTRGGM